MKRSFAWYRNRRYGRSSEQLSAAEQQQIRLFNEIERSADHALPVDPLLDASPAESAAAPAPSRARRPRRQPLPPSLPRVERVVDLPEADQQCACGHRMVRIGEETAEKLDVIPPQVRAAPHGAAEVRLPSLRGLRRRAACGGAGGAGAGGADPQRSRQRRAAGVHRHGEVLRRAAAVPAGAAGFARLGVAVSRRTMADWMLAVAGACRPLLAALDDQLRSGPVLQIDETTVQVLNEPGRANATRSYVWVACGGPPAAPVVIYRYEPSSGRTGGGRHHRRLSGLRADRWV